MIIASRRIYLKNRSKAQDRLFVCVCAFLPVSQCIYIHRIQQRSSGKKLFTVFRLPPPCCGLLEDGRMSSFILQDNAIFICQDLSQCLLYAKCSLNASQNKIVNKNISGQALL